MLPEEMGKVTKRFRWAFAASSVVFLAGLAISPVREYLRSWKRYERDYVRFAQTRPDTKRLLEDFRFEISQIWIPKMDVVDRCTTCHQGITELSLQDSTVPQPFRAHPPIPHQVRDWGCVICHRGQGLATEVRDAHETTLAWEQPILPVEYIQASCGVCHRSELREAPRLDRGREILARLNWIPPCLSPSEPIHPYRIKCAIGDALFAIVAKAWQQKFVTRTKPRLPGSSPSCPASTSRLPAVFATAPN